nr:MAG TPA: hypothetical protein [Caudoviricetes sp.]
MMILHQQPKAATDGMFTQPSPVYRSSAISLLRLLIILYLYFVHVFVVCGTNGSLDGLRGIFGKVDTVIVVVFAVLALVGASGDERTLFPLNQPHTVQVDTVQPQSESKAVVCDLPHVANNGLQFVQHFHGNAGAVCCFLRGGCVVVFLECHNNSLLCCLSVYIPRGTAYFVVFAAMVRNKSIMVSCFFSMACRWEIAVVSFVLTSASSSTKFSKKSVNFSSRAASLLLISCISSPLSEHPANKELQPCRGRTLRKKRGRVFRKNIRDVMIVRFQVSIQVCQRPFTERVRVVCGCKRERLPRCFDQRGPGQGLLRSQILHCVHQLPRRVKHKPDNVPRDIFPNLNLRDTFHIKPPRPCLPDSASSACPRRPRSERSR